MSSYGPKNMPSAVLSHIHKTLEIDESQSIVKRVKHHGFAMGHDPLPETSIIRLNMPIKFPYLKKIHKPAATIISDDDAEFPGFRWFLVTVDTRFFYFVQGLRRVLELCEDDFDLCFPVRDLPLGSQYQVSQLIVHACTYCKKLAPHLHACGPCKVHDHFYFYCSKTCQVADWPAHKHICCKSTTRL